MMLLSGKYLFKFGNKNTWLIYFFPNVKAGFQHANFSALV